MEKSIIEIATIFWNNEKGEAKVILNTKDMENLNTTEIMDCLEDVIEQIEVLQRKNLKKISKK